MASFQSPLQKVVTALAKSVKDGAAITPEDLSSVPEEVRAKLIDAVKIAQQARDSILKIVGAVLERLPADDRRLVADEHPFEELINALQQLVEESRTGTNSLSDKSTNDQAHEELLSKFIDLLDSAAEGSKRLDDANLPRLMRRGLVSTLYTTSTSVGSLAMEISGAVPEAAQFIDRTAAIFQGIVQAIHKVERQSDSDNRLREITDTAVSKTLTLNGERIQTRLPEPAQTLFRELLTADHEGLEVVDLARRFCGAAYHVTRSDHNQATLFSDALRYLILQAPRAIDILRGATARDEQGFFRHFRIADLSYHLLNYPGTLDTEVGSSDATPDQKLRVGAAELLALHDPGRYSDLVRKLPKYSLVRSNGEVALSKHAARRISDRRVIPNIEPDLSTWISFAANLPSEHAISDLCECHKLYYKDQDHAAFILKCLDTVPLPEVTRWPAWMPTWLPVFNTASMNASSFGLVVRLLEDLASCGDLRHAALFEAQAAKLRLDILRPSRDGRGIVDLRELARKTLRTIRARTAPPHEATTPRENG